MGISKAVERLNAVKDLGFTFNNKSMHAEAYIDKNFNLTNSFIQQSLEKEVKQEQFNFFSSKTRAKRAVNLTF